MARMATVPCISGIIRSMSTTSGCTSSHTRTASLPLAASPTNSRSSNAARKAPSPLRTTAWSSTINTRTRFGSLISTTSSMHNRRCKKRPFALPFVSMGNTSLWPDNHDLRAIARPTFDLQCCADRLGALAHDAQPQVLQRDIGWIEPVPVVADTQLQLLRLAAQAYHRLAGTSMVGHIVQGLLRDSI